MKGIWECIEAAAGCEDLPQSVPTTGMGWQWQQVFPTKPSQVQSHCVAGRLLLLLSKPWQPPFPGFSLPAPQLPGWWVSQQCLLEAA